MQVPLAVHPTLASRHGTALGAVDQDFWVGGVADPLTIEHTRVPFPSSRPTISSVFGWLLLQ
jgi:hypothetical protein